MQEDSVEEDIVEVAGWSRTSATLCRMKEDRCKGRGTRNMVREDRAR
jgi:hypothetical protein